MLMVVTVNWASKWQNLEPTWTLMATVIWSLNWPNLQLTPGRLWPQWIDLQTDPILNLQCRLWPRWIDVQNDITKKLPVNWHHLQTYLIYSRYGCLWSQWIDIHTDLELNLSAICVLKSVKKTIWIIDKLRLFNQLPCLDYDMAFEFEFWKLNHVPIQKLAATIGIFDALYMI